MQLSSAIEARSSNLDVWRRPRQHVRNSLITHRIQRASPLWTLTNVNPNVSMAKTDLVCRSRPWRAVCNPNLVWGYWLTIKMSAKVAEVWANGETYFIRRLQWATTKNSSPKPLCNKNRETWKSQQTSASTATFRTWAVSATTRARRLVANVKASNLKKWKIQYLRNANKTADPTTTTTVSPRIKQEKIFLHIKKSKMMIISIS